MAGAFRVVFDIADQPLRVEPWMVVVVVLPVVFGLLLLRGRKGGALGLFVGGAGLLIGLFALVVGLGGYLLNWSTLLEARREGAYRITEGCLQAFHPMAESGHEMERLRVGGQDFEYSDYVVTPAFSNTESHGGPVHADSRVRLWSVNGDIIRLEVIDHACPAAPDLPEP